MLLICISIYPIISLSRIILKLLDIQNDQLNIFIFYFVLGLLICFVYHYFIYEETHIKPGKAGECNKKEIIIYNTYIAPGLSGGIYSYEIYKYEFEFKLPNKGYMIYTTIRNGEIYSIPILLE